MESALFDMHSKEIGVGDLLSCDFDEDDNVLQSWMLLPTYIVKKDKNGQLIACGIMQDFQICRDRMKLTKCLYKSTENFPDYIYHALEDAIKMEFK